MAEIDLNALWTPDAGNIDLKKRPVVNNPDGSYSTVRSMSFNEDGKEVLIPTVAADGSRILSEKEAIDQYHQSGQHLGKFGSPEQATAYAKQLHEQQAKDYGPQARETPKAPPVQEQKRRIGGKEDLGLVSAGVQWVESHGNPLAVGPETKSGRAYGLMGLQEATAREMGAKDDAYKTDGNISRELGEKRLSQLHEKYGNWEDALGGYVAGPAKIDDWIAKGRPDDELAKQVHKYIDGVLGHSNLDSPGRRFVASKGALTNSDLHDIWSTFKHPSDGSPGPQGTPASVPDPSTPYGEAPEDEEGFMGAYNAFAAGAAKELLNVPFGAAQAVLEQVAPEQAQKMTDWKNKLDERYAGAADAHPYVGFAGQVFGMTAGIMGAGGLVTAGAKALIPQVGALAAKVPLIARGAAGGAAASGLQFNPNADPNDRLWEAPIGALFGGALGLPFAKAAAWTLRHIVDEGAQKTFIKELADAAQNLGPNVSKVKDAVLDTLGKQDAEMRASVEKAQLLSQQLAAQARQAVEEEKGTPAIHGISEQALKIMGVHAEEARRDAAKVADDKFQKAMTEWRDKIKAKAGTNAGPTLIQAHMNRAIAKGDKPPVAPAPYVERPITGANYAKGIQYLQTVHRQAGDAAKKGAIRRLIRGMEGEAGAAVRDAGGKFTPVGPLRGAFGAVKRGMQERFGSDWQTARGAAEFSQAHFYGWLKDVIKRGDYEEIEGLKRIVSGPEAQKAITNDVMHQMLMEAGPNAKGPLFDPTKIHQYILDHGAALRHLLTRDEYAKLEGFAKISQRLTEDGLTGRVASHAHGRIFGWSGYLGIVGLERIITGHVTEGATLAASGFIAHSLYNFGSRIFKMQNVEPLLRRAAKLRPDSRELDEQTAKIMRQYALRFNVTGRVVGGAVSDPESYVKMLQ